ncbi:MULTISPECIES: hypothetical protein [unclassified Streptomyces]|uniref:hypothetical protein n=1 Tax=unclassified Streptomyces TaxID=2593676 RepID=UPI003BB7DADD
MTPALRTARTLTAAATTASGTAAYLAYTGSYWLAAATVYVAAFLAWCARRDYQRHHVIRARAIIRERAARGLPTAPSVFDTIPCCDLASHGDGRTHGPDCVRPPDPADELNAAYCVDAFVFHGATHAANCPTRTTRSNAA